MGRIWIVRMVAVLTAASAVALGAGCSNSSPEAGTANENNKPPAEKAPPPKAPSKAPTGPNTTGPDIGDVDAKTSAEVKAFVQEYLVAVDGAYKTKNTAKVEAMSAPSCEECHGIKAFFQRMDRWGYKVQGTRKYIDPEIKLAGKTGKTVTVYVKTGVTEYKVLDKDGEVDDTLGGIPKGDQQETFEVQKAGAEWRVTSWDGLG